MLLQADFGIFITFYRNTKVEVNLIDLTRLESSYPRDLLNLGRLSGTSN